MTNLRHQSFRQNLVPQRVVFVFEILHNNVVAVGGHLLALEQDGGDVDEHTAASLIADPLLTLGQLCLDSKQRGKLNTNKNTFNVNSSYNSERHMVMHKDENTLYMYIM